MTQPIGMPEDRRPRVLLDIAHEGIATAGDKQIDIVVESQQGVDIIARFNHLHHIDTALIHAGNRRPDQLAEKPVRCLRFRTAFHNHRVARLPTQ